MQTANHVDADEPIIVRTVIWSNWQTSKDLVSTPFDLAFPMCPLHALLPGVRADPVWATHYRPETSSHFSSGSNPLAGRFGAGRESRRVGEGEEGARGTIFWENDWFEMWNILLIKAKPRRKEAVWYSTLFEKNHVHLFSTIYNIMTAIFPVCIYSSDYIE